MTQSYIYHDRETGKIQLYERADWETGTPARVWNEYASMHKLPERDYDEEEVIAWARNEIGELLAESAELVDCSGGRCRPRDEHAAYRLLEIEHEIEQRVAECRIGREIWDAWDWYGRPEVCISVLQIDETHSRTQIEAMIAENVEFADYDGMDVHVVGIDAFADAIYEHLHNDAD